MGLPNSCGDIPHVKAQWLDFTDDYTHCAFPGCNSENVATVDVYHMLDVRGGPWE